MTRLIAVSCRVCVCVRGVCIRGVCVYGVYCHEFGISIRPNPSPDLQVERTGSPPVARSVFKEEAGTNVTQESVYTHTHLSDT